MKKINCFIGKNIMLAVIGAVALVLIATDAEGSKMKPSFYYKVETAISTDKPKLNEPIIITCKITSDRDIDKASITLRFAGVEVVGDIKPIGFYAEEIQIK